MSTEIDSYKQAWKRFQDTMTLLRQKKLEILVNISKKFDEQKIESLRKKLTNYE